MHFTLCVCSSLFTFFYLNEAHIINIDVYHKKRKSKGSLHHFAISAFVENCKGLTLHIHDFLFSCFLNKLDQHSFQICWKTLLHYIDQFGYCVPSWIRSFRAIITHFSTAQANAIQNTTVKYLPKVHKFNNNDAKYLIRHKLQGCKFHFQESVKRVKTSLPQKQQPKFKYLTSKIENKNTSQKRRHLFDTISERWPSLKNCTNYWRNQNPINLLTYELNPDQRTNNPIETLHSKLSKPDNIVEQYSDLLSLKIHNFNQMYQIVNNNISQFYHQDYRSYLKKKHFKMTLSRSVQQQKQDKTSRAPDRHHQLNYDNYIH